MAMLCLLLFPGATEDEDEDEDEDVEVGVSSCVAD